MTKIHESTLRVFYKDTDAGGVVHHVAYLRFAERARAEFFRFCGREAYGYIKLGGKGIVVARHVAVEYFMPVFLQEELRMRTRVVEFRTTSFVMESSMYRGEDLVNIVTMTQVFLDDAGRPTPIPQPFREALS
jgi:acyl-CoA thioester hydrolase